MILGKIDYTNLAPFHVFLKRYIRNTQAKASINYHKSYPAKINKLFKTRKVDAGFISSIESFRGDYKRFDAGIVAFMEVRSVLVKKGTTKCDIESASVLAKILNIKGEVIIGDKALKLYLEEKEKYQDLCTIWYEREALPFVFARFCVNKHFGFYEKLIKNFLKQKVKIPQYIQEKYSKKSGISKKEISSYLKLISYKINYKEKKALKRFKMLSTFRGF